MIKSKSGRLMIVDDEVESISTLRDLLSGHGYMVAGYTSGKDALEALKEQDFDLLLTDHIMPEMDGIELLKAALEIAPNLGCIIITGKGTIQSAVEAMKVGAFDYVLKPVEFKKLLMTLSRAMGVHRLQIENLQLRETVAIYELSQAIAFTLDLNTILNKVADAAIQQLEADEASIMLPTPEGNELYIVTVRGENRETLLWKHMPIEQGIAGWVARHYEPLTLNGMVTDHRFKPIKSRANIRSAISMPMLVGGKLAGVLNVNSTQQRRPFTLGQVKALNILAGTAASALESAHLYAQVREAEEKYRLLVNTANETIVVIQDGMLKFVNPKTVELTGYSEEELTLRPFVHFIHPDDREMVLNNHLKRLRGETIPDVYPFRIVGKDGSTKCVEISTVLITWEGRPAILNFISDVTERERAEKALRGSEGKLNAMLQSIGDHMSIQDKDLNIIWANETAKKIFGNDIIGKKCYEAYHKRKEPCEPYPCFTLKAFQDGKVHEHDTQVIDKDGKIIYFYCTANVALRDKEGKPTAVIEIYRDITENKQVEERLKTASNEWRITFDSTTDLIMLLDSEMTIIKANLATAKFLNRPFNEIVGKNYYKLFHGTDKPPAGCPLEKMKMTKKHEETELYLPEKDIWIRISVDPIFDDKGNLIRSVHVIRDITERKRIEEKLQAYQEQLRSLASQLSLVEERERRRIAIDLHDHIGQTLALCKIKLGALRESTPTNLIESLDEIRDLTEQIIRYTRSLTFELSPPILYDLGFEAAVEWLGEKIIKQHGIQFCFEDDKQSKPLDDEARILLFQAVRELLINIVKHAQAHNAKVSIRRDNDNIRINIEDDGVGFDTSKIDSSLRTGCFGIFSIRERLKHLGGLFEIESEPGRRTRVTIVAPLKARNIISS